MTVGTRSGEPAGTGADWKNELLSSGGGDPLPEGYRRQGEVIGREELLEVGDRRRWSESQFVARARTPNTTSAAEALIRRRHLGRLVESHGIDPARPALELGCADGLVTHSLLDLGFQRLVSTDLMHETVETLEGSLNEDLRSRVLLIVDDMMRLPFEAERFATVIAWGVLSVTEDFDRALDLAWRWVAPGGYLLLAEPTIESVLVYALVRGDLAEFRRAYEEGTRPGVWEERYERDDRYRVNSMGFYRDRLARLPSASLIERGGVNLFPSLVLGGLTQDAPIPDQERSELFDMLSDPALDQLETWRQAFWLLRKG